MKKYQLSRIYSVLKDRSRSGFPTGSFFVESAWELFFISEYKVLVLVRALLAFLFLTKF